jgi:hypothetical protein
MAATIDDSIRFGSILGIARIEVSDDDLAAWNTIDDLPTDLATQITTDSLDFEVTAGGFSVDLTDIQGYCKDSYDTNGNAYCPYEKIAEYDGWAVGLYFTTQSSADAYNDATIYTNYSLLICFDNESCIGGYFRAASSAVTANVWCGSAIEILDADSDYYSVEYGDCYEFGIKNESS